MQYDLTRADEVSSTPPEAASRTRYARTFLFGLLSAGAIGFLDYTNGHEITLAAFYALPVILVVWYANRWLAFGMALCAVFIRFWADFASGMHYSSEWIRVWNGAVAVLFLGLIVVGFSAVKAQLDRSRSRVRQLETTLPICSCCKKIEDENGAWSSLETYLQDRFGSKATVKICADCSRKLYASKMGPG